MTYGSASGSLGVKISRFSALLIGLFIIVITTVGCSTKEHSSSIASPLSETKWILTSVRGLADVDAERQAYIQFLSDDNRITGVSGCNSFFGQYQIDKTTLALSGLGSTKMLCRDMRVEDAFLSLLANVTEFSIEGSTLTLFDAEGAAATFAAATPD